MTSFLDRKWAAVPELLCVTEDLIGWIKKKEKKTAFQVFRETSAVFHSFHEDPPFCVCSEPGGLDLIRSTTTTTTTTTTTKENRSFCDGLGFFSIVFFFFYFGLSGPRASGPAAAKKKRKRPRKSARENFAEQNEWNFSAKKKNHSGKQQETQQTRKPTVR